MAKLILSVGTNTASYTLKNDDGSTIFTYSGTRNDVLCNAQSKKLPTPHLPTTYTADGNNGTFTVAFKAACDRCYLTHTKDGVTTGYYFSMPEYDDLYQVEQTNNVTFNENGSIEWNSVPEPYVCSLVKTRECPYPSIISSVRRDNNNVSFVLRIRMWIGELKDNFINGFILSGDIYPSLKAIKHNGKNTGYYETEPFTVTFNPLLNSQGDSYDPERQDLNVIRSSFTFYDYMNGKNSLYIFLPLQEDQEDEENSLYLHKEYDTTNQILFKQTNDLLAFCTNVYTVLEHESRIASYQFDTSNLVWYHNDFKNTDFVQGVLSGCDPGNYTCMHTFTQSGVKTEGHNSFPEEAVVCGFVYGTGVIYTSGTILMKIDSEHPTTIANRVYDKQQTFSFSGTSGVGNVGTLDTNTSEHPNVTVIANCTLDDVSVSSTETKRVVTVEYTLEGEDASYYLPPKPDDVFIDITPAPLTISGTSIKDKYYDNSTTATVVLGIVSGVLPGDIVGLTPYLYDGNTSSTKAVVFGSKNVGTYNVNVKYVLTGADAGNYVIDYGGNNSYVVLSGEIKSFTVTTNVVGVSYKAQN